MQNLKSLTNEKLLAETRRLVHEERQIGIAVLEHLHEIEARQLYLECGHSTLFAHCRKELGYSENQAQLRIDAMHALKETPVIESDVRSGALNVTSVAKVHRFLRKEQKRTGAPYLPGARADLFATVKGKGAKEVEAELIRRSPESAIPQDRERMLTTELTELKLVVPAELLEQLKTLQGLYSHRMSNPQSMRELVQLLATDALKSKLKPHRETVQRDVSVSIKVNATESAKNLAAPKPRSRYIPAPLRRAVWKRDGGACSFRHPSSKQTCGSRHFLQIDHVTPFARGGSSEDPANLRLLCSAHNRFAWRQFGHRPS